MIGHGPAKLSRKLLNDSRLPTPGPKKATSEIGGFKEASGVKSFFTVQTRDLTTFHLLHDKHR